jgi:hypothetical protein
MESMIQLLLTIAVFVLTIAWYVWWQLVVRPAIREGRSLGSGDAPGPQRKR